jgi:hypothetical protein
MQKNLGAIFNTFDHIVKKTCLKIFSVVGALDGALLHIIFSFATGGLC